ncbi:hypothetical protein LTR56_026056 [Elasticomyces elasticus]|nr:hypothetical protein LTR56_026056 [Elasticomyces elasticus]KAK3617867.1 hypothetical protein LTR22_026582 [Elasticomyces elasticus]KAK4905351.1 hypothetical protein LTR49_025336 [Elasticomyces elasticus]KAK5739097.1 hypothetical protein LTS12_025405 [Elasticomyces elasticus]
MTVSLTLPAPKLCHSLSELMACGYDDEKHLPLNLRREGDTCFATTNIANDPRKVTKILGPMFNSWDTSEVKDFNNKQWQFLAPVFSPEQFEHWLNHKHPLTYTRPDSVLRCGHFGYVWEAHLDPSHQKGFHWMCEPDLNNELKISIAVKEYRNDTDLAKRSWEDEKRVFSNTGAGQHKHLVERIAAIAQGDQYYLLLEWANGGNLKKFWETRPERSTRIDASEVLEILTQFVGLAGAILHMHTGRSNTTEGHPPSRAASMASDTIIDGPEIPSINAPDEGLKTHWRHGDLKPENILVFKQLGCWLGLLKIADLGLTKGHADITANRPPSTQIHATRQYEAPEVQTGRLTARSRRFDIWSFGCVMLETVIWMLYGYDTLNEFWTVPYDGKNTLYYTITGQSAQVSEAAKSWMQQIQSNDPECSETRATVLGDLLRLARDKLIVVKIPERHEEGLPGYRADAKRLCEDLEAILARAKIEPGYLCTESIRDNLPFPSHDHVRYQSANSLGVPDPANKRERTVSRQRDNSLLGGSMSPAAVKQRLDQHNWKLSMDRHFAVEIFNMLKAEPSPRQLFRHSNLCQRCRNIDFRGHVSIRDTRTDLAANSTVCDLCRLISRAARFDGSTSDMSPLTLRLVNSGLVSGEGRATKRLLELCQWPDERSNKALPHLRLSLPQRPPVDSPAHFGLLRRWLNDCEINHVDCRPNRAPAELALTPKRIIDVGTQAQPGVCLAKSQDLRLDTGSSPRYVALSYAWGDERFHKRFTSTKQNHARLERGIVVADLPKTFRDAIEVTKQLGVRYLWIDALCILQGLDGDFDSEAERMEIVFSNAYCVIAASRATGTSDGFLGEREGQQVVGIAQSQSATVYVTEPVDNFQEDVIDGHLNKRGWVLQGRALARRTIFFTAKQTYWQCGNGVRCETLSRLDNTQATFLGDPNFPKVAEDGSKGARIRLYEFLYRSYTTLAFSHVKDRPIAIAGLESRLARAFGTDGGFGVFGKYFHRGILWHRAVKPLMKIGSLGPANKTPSWSWMSYEGAIEFMDVPFGGVDWQEKDLKSPWAPQTTPAALRHSIRSGSNHSLQVVPRVFTTATDGRTSSEGSLIYDQATPEIEGSIKCVVVGKHRTGFGSSATQRHYVLLVRQRSSSFTYERVGVGYLPGRFIDFSEPKQLVQVN